jgi:hypothetical protein
LGLAEACADKIQLRSKSAAMRLWSLKAWITKKFYQVATGVYVYFLFVLTQKETKKSRAKYASTRVPGHPRIWLWPPRRHSNYIAGKAFKLENI